jgi:hypothetical protein
MRAAAPAAGVWRGPERWPLPKSNGQHISFQVAEDSISRVIITSKATDRCRQAADLPAVDQDD